jgi:hypothetical protein
MEKRSRIKFNPVSKEIEIEGSEKFVKTYFDKLQGMISGSEGKRPAVKGKPIKAKAVPPRRAKKAAGTAKASHVIKAKKIPKMVKHKTGKKSPAAKRTTNIDAVVTLIREYAEGITTAELKEKTGLAESQIWNIVNRATKEGRISKIKRGVYGVGEDIPEIEGPVIE